MSIWNQDSPCMPLDIWNCSVIPRCAIRSQTWVSSSPPRPSCWAWHSISTHTLLTRLHEHAIFGVVSVFDTCQTPERVRRAGFRCPAVSLFFFFFFSDSPTRLRCGSDMAPTRLRRVRHASNEKKKKKKEKKHRFWQVDLPIPLIS